MADPEGAPGGTGPVGKGDAEGSLAGSLKLGGRGGVCAGPSVAPAVRQLNKHRLRVMTGNEKRRGGNAHGAEIKVAEVIGLQKGSSDAKSVNNAHASTKRKTKS